jgi:hypothetical protein
METMDSLLEKHKSWVDTYEPLENSFVAKRFETGGQAILNTVDELGSLLASFFTGKKPLDICGFELTTRSDGTMLAAFIDLNSDGFLNGYAQSIPADIFVKAMAMTDKEVAVKYEANGMGFAWRADNERIIEAMDVIALLEAAKEND